MKFSDGFVKLRPRGCGSHLGWKTLPGGLDFFALKSDLSVDPQSLASSQRGLALLENHLPTEVKLLRDPELEHWSLPLKEFNKAGGGNDRVSNLSGEGM